MKKNEGLKIIGKWKFEIKDSITGNSSTLTFNSKSWRISRRNGR